MASGQWNVFNMLNIEDDVRQLSDTFLLREFITSVGTGLLGDLLAIIYMSPNLQFGNIKSKVAVAAAGCICN